jgi:nucleotide-binding universal stress UspA family protein
MNRTYRIVVGVDGSEASNHALRWAAAEARARHGTVQAITVWNWDSSGTLAPMASAPIDERERAERVLATALAGIVDDYPDVPFATDVVEDRPGRALTHAAQDADILVLGSHGHSRLHHAVLGSISEECVRQATCPVVVLPVPHLHVAAKTEAVATR